MIVNTAYAFMAKAKKLFTHLFENGKSNYPTDFAANVVLNETGLIIPIADLKAAFLEIPLSKFKALNFTGNGTPYGPSYVRIAIIKPTGDIVSNTNFYKLESSGSTFVYQIPNNCRVDGYTVAFISANVGGPVTITNAVFDM